MKRVLALGGAGFIGSYVVRELLQHGYSVTVVDNFSKYGFLPHDVFDHPACTLVRGDVRELRAEQFEGFDAVLCLAALIGGIKYFHKIPYRIASENSEILITAIERTLEAAPAATFVYFSSSMVYERVDHPVTEADALNQPVPITNYGMQKLFGEFLVRGAHQERGLEYLIVRPFNAVGSGELPATGPDGQVEFGMAHVIPDFICKALLRQAPFQIFGDGQQVRTFTHARDIAAAVRLMLDQGVRNEDFNICGDCTLSMADLARAIWAKINPDIQFGGFEHQPVPESDVRFRVGVAHKAEQWLGWRPRHSLNDIIDDTLGYIQPRMAAVG
jgi:nucleoside-diphosphate-sugar epimerase